MLLGCSQNIIIICLLLNGYKRSLPQIINQSSFSTQNFGIKGFLKPCVNTKSTKPTWPWFPAGSGVSFRHTMTAE